MKRRIAWSGLAAVGCTASLAGGAAAHHSGAMFNREEVTTVVGELKEYRFENPHPWLLIATMTPEGEKEYDVEAPSLGGMKSVNLTPSTLKAGDKITVRVHPLKDGRPAGSLIDIKMADGHVVTAPAGRAQSGR